MIDWTSAPFFKEVHIGDYGIHIKFVKRKANMTIANLGKFYSVSAILKMIDEAPDIDYVGEYLKEKLVEDGK